MLRERPVSRCQTDVRRRVVGGCLHRASAAWIPRARGSRAPLPTKSSIAHAHRSPPKAYVRLCFPLFAAFARARNATPHLSFEEASMATTGRRPPWPHPCAPAGSLPALLPVHYEEKQLRCSAVDLAVRGERRRSGERERERCTPTASSLRRSVHWLRSPSLSGILPGYSCKEG
jgi:hypothetical protein